MTHAHHLEVNQLQEEQHQVLTEAIAALEGLLVVKGDIEVSSSASESLRVCRKFADFFKSTLRRHVRVVSRSLMIE